MVDLETSSVTYIEVFQVSPKVGNNILPLCNVAVMTNVLAGWRNADSSHIHQGALVKMSGLGWVHWLQSLRVKWQKQGWTVFHMQRRPSSRERGPQGATKILQQVYTCLATILLKLTSCKCWISTHFRVFFPALLRKVAVVRGPKLPWYFAFIKTSNTVISVETGTSPCRKGALFNVLFSNFF